MQLAITVLSLKPSFFINDVMSAIDACQCNVLELRTSHLSQTTAAYLLIEGNWNHVAKLESLLEGLKIRHGLQIGTVRPEASKVEFDGVPYLLETICSDRPNVLFQIIGFLTNHQITIEEITAHRHPAAYFNNPVCTTKFILLVPPSIRILSFREEFLDFCDSLNVDAILEPIKR